MSESLKKLVELPQHLQEFLSELPNEVADKCLEDTSQYILIYESIYESLEGLGLDKAEAKPFIVSGVVQYYEDISE